ncbi:LptF/LptG family permease [Campylobacter insulaenigrae]|uniref:LptF/LptG family permease n=1 Tax=Campylobacter insulaenigrae TaxID=260714 RepID=A0ABY3G4H9_9BACT|nr:LptF/LptG family permease [Campylobacter insulaenigrae]MCR6570311.1 LptF/LptG family permease [Campylobacter insulaenigrae]MCR6571713.1 LptF/LptG family permease [Campylobacter insulaenigrae]MCR6573350.1 LptF/LptG family permease [Campylobacter insulaenigrae]MCR6574815.1 LptF/LptG family permease [Campylobacter insulaenigrae]MCR6576493.1 LptF/LptG family permease [Campylobacter insulaenigrae]
MKLVYKYLLNQFLNTMLSLFFTLFVIVSIIFFIQLANITSYVEITIVELFQLYIYLLPKTLAFTLPISFFIALTLSFYRLSRENESIVLFTLGISPKIIAIFFMKIAGIISAFMLVVVLIFIPISFELFDNFIDYKKISTKINIKTGEFGQKYGDWLIFVDEKNADNIYKNIIMYHPKKKPDDKEQIILAKEGKLENQEGYVSFKLDEGKAYEIKNDNWHISSFKNLLIKNKIYSKELSVKNFYDYWSDLNTRKEKAKEFVIYTLIALFPLASTLFALSFGIVTYRYEKGFAYLGIFSVIFVYFSLLISFYRPPLIAVGIIFVSFLIVSIIYFRKKILSRY